MNTFNDNDDAGGHGAKKRQINEHSGHGQHTVEGVKWSVFVIL